jgi:hypothetical protein
VITKAFFIAAGERAVKTFCQTLAALLLATGGVVDLIHATWADNLSIAGGAAFLSILTSVASMSPVVPAAASIIYPSIVPLGLTAGEVKTMPQTFDSNQQVIAQDGETVEEAAEKAPPAEQPVEAPVTVVTPVQAPVPMKGAASA